MAAPPLIRFPRITAPETDDVHVRFVRIDEVIPLNQYRNVARDDTGGVFSEFVVVDTDHVVVRISRAAHGPQSGHLAFLEFIVGDGGVVARGAKRMPTRFLVK